MLVHTTTTGHIGLFQAYYLDYKEYRFQTSLVSFYNQLKIWTYYHLKRAHICSQLIYDADDTIANEQQL